MKRLAFVLVALVGGLLSAVRADDVTLEIRAPGGREDGPRSGGRRRGPEADRDQGHLQQGHAGRHLVVGDALEGELPEDGRQAEVSRGQADLRAAGETGAGQDLRHLGEQREVRATSRTPTAGPPSRTCWCSRPRSRAWRASRPREPPESAALRRLTRTSSFGAAAKGPAINGRPAEDKPGKPG